MTLPYNGWGLMPKASLSRMDPFGAGPAAPRPAGREHRVSQRAQRILTLRVLPARTTVQRSNAFGRAGVPSLCSMWYRSCGGLIIQSSREVKKIFHLQLFGPPLQIESDGTKIFRRKPHESQSVVQRFPPFPECPANNRPEEFLIVLRHRLAYSEPHNG